MIQKWFLSSLLRVDLWPIAMPPAPPTSSLKQKSGHLIWESDELHHKTAIAGTIKTSHFGFLTNNIFKKFVWRIISLPQNITNYCIALQINHFVLLSLFIYHKYLVSVFDSLLAWEAFWNVEMTLELSSYLYHLQW